MFMKSWVRDFVAGFRDPLRLVILTEGQTHPTPAKMAAGVLRFRPQDVVALLDSQKAGMDAAALMGVGQGIPIISDLALAHNIGANTLLLGITPAGGQLPTAWRQTILQAITLGMDVISGMHTFLNDDLEFKNAAASAEANLFDLRRTPDDLTVSQCRSALTSTFRIHTVGTDCNCGKKVTAIYIHRELQRRGLSSEFIATGQTGVLISGKGMALDRVIGDFISGAAERLVLENQIYDYLVIEGQGSLTHPLYAGVTLSMLYGFAPQALILCHQVDRSVMRGTPNTPVPSVQTMIDLYERITQPVYPARVLGIALNMMNITDDHAAREHVERTHKETGLPVTDVVRLGAANLVDAILQYQKEREPSV
jgi:uncharacterized NAD-dependent epimerase/dehydratase family protein